VVLSASSGPVWAGVSAPVSTHGFS
jgi:hypothetical protein